MADLTTYPVLSVCATVESRLPELVIKDGQLIYIQDIHKVAFDYNGKRKFYNQIEELNTEQERISLLAPISGMFYFILDTSVLWIYQGKWIQITSNPSVVKDVVERVEALEMYLFDIDYDSFLSFDTSEIVFNNAATSVLGQAILGQMVLA